jgi:RimJ/RimL family protein N-acetyltransferase
VITNEILNQKIPVINEAGTCIANLVPISHKKCDINLTAKLLSEWRNENRNCFLTEFEVTEESSLNWIKNFWLSSNLQELFLVEIEDRYVGHYGFKNLTKNTVLLDNAIRGESGGEAKLFYYVGMTLINWIFLNTSVGRIDGSVFSDNIPAIMMNKQLGFKGWQKFNLKKTMVGDSISWEKTDESNQNNQSRSVYEIYINREDWNLME